LQKAEIIAAVNKLSLAPVYMLQIKRNEKSYLQPLNKPRSMKPGLLINKSIEMNAGPAKVWDALVNPEKIKQYFPGAETTTDWKIGSEIVFTHQYEGQEFKNKGVILNFDPNHLLSYTYWTAFSNTEDKPENYTTITFSLSAINDTTTLTLTQTNFKNEEWYRSLETGWDFVLGRIKEITEK
jgi:uncharacterized protein YndB with AHSA1/START domain